MAETHEIWDMKDQNADEDCRVCIYLFCDHILKITWFFYFVRHVLGPSL